MTPDSRKEITNLDELFAYAVAVHRGESEFKPINIKATNLSFSIKICGEGWDERIDARTARYIMDMQAACDELMEECGLTKEPADRPLIKASINKGSTKIVADLISVVKGLNMALSPDQYFIVIISAIAAMVGTPVLLRLIDRRSKERELTQHEITKRDAIAGLVNMAKESGLQTQQYEKPLRTLIMKGIGENDVISLDGEKAKAEEARQLFPRKERSTTSTSYADGEYLLHAINYTADDQPVLLLSRDGMEIKAYTSQLSDDDANNLFMDIVTRQRTEALPISIELQINIHHTARKIKYGSVVGVGPQREGKEHKHLREIING